MTARSSAAFTWYEAAAEVEDHLENLRLGEMKRYSRKLRGATDEQRALVHQLTRQVLRRAVLDALRDAGASSAAMRPEELALLRRLFAGKTDRKESRRAPTRGEAGLSLTPRAASNLH